MTGETSKRRSISIMSSPLRPPAQVYTRGTVGSVKTRPRSEQRDAYSHDGSVSTNSRSTSRRTANRSRDGSPDTTKYHARTARKVIDDLNRSYNNPERRIEAITTACEAFDHTDEGKHNVELYHGAAPALAKLLAATNRDDELRMTLAATEMVFRGSPKSITAVFPKLNGFLANLLRLLERLEQTNPAHAEVSLLNIARILYSASRSSELRSLLLRQSGMLRILSQAPSNADCRVTRTRLLANLANCEDNKILLYEQDNLLDTVLRLAHRDSSPLVRQYSAAALCEFSSAPANQISMAANDAVLGTMVKMVLVEKSAHTRESATTVLQNLAFPKKNRTVLVEFKQGVVLEALKQALSTDPVATSRRRAAGALTNLVCEGTALRMGQQNGLLDTLAIVATKDENSDVQSRAALALTKIGGLIDVRDSCHDALLDALVVASLSKASNSVTTVLRVKARNQEHREVMARHAGVMDTLCDMLVAEKQASGVDRDNSIRAILHLVNEDKNRKLLCNKTLLSALVTASETTDTQDAAIRALERLATEVSNRATMAHHEGLLVTVAAAVEREAEWEREGQASEFGRLAKPLLMSLLVAM